MILFVVITNKYDFSIQVIEYFKSQNITNHHWLLFYPIGLDKQKEEYALDNLKEYLSKHPRVETMVLFSDVGAPTNVAKIIEKDVDIKQNVVRSLGSLIENGFLAYLMLNTKAPIESTESIINKIIDKK